MLNFLKNLFTRNPSFPLGALENPPDHRNIELASFQAPILLPMEYITEMPSVENQGNKPDCVGQAISKVIEMRYKQAGIVVDLSARDLYKQCKAIDGLYNIDGTYPIIGAKIAVKGIADINLVPDDNNLPTTNFLGYQESPEIIANRAKFKITGYAFVANDYNAICQAIYQNKAIVASVQVDYNWFNGIIGKVTRSVGRHCIVFHGFDTIKQSIYGQNSWGVNWVGYIAGIFNSKVKSGHFEVSYNDIKDSVIDMIVFADVPENLLQKVKNTSKLDLWCMGIQEMEGYIAPCKQYPTGTRAWKNKNPGNLRYVGQTRAIGHDDKNFCIFKTYQDGYETLKYMLKRAGSGESKSYNPNMTLYQFFAKYAPSSDGNYPKHYAEVVAKRIGVSASVQIKSLID
jgi:hypothetical protein